MAGPTGRGRFVFGVFFFFILEAGNPHTGGQSECFDLGGWSRENPRKALLAALLLEYWTPIDF